MGVVFAHTIASAILDRSDSATVQLTDKATCTFARVMRDSHANVRLALVHTRE